MRLDERVFDVDQDLQEFSLSDLVGVELNAVRCVAECASGRVETMRLKSLLTPRGTRDADQTGDFNIMYAIDNLLYMRSHHGTRGHGTVRHLNMAVSRLQLRIRDISETERQASNNLLYDLPA